MKPIFFFSVLFLENKRTQIINNNKSVNTNFNNLPNKSKLLWLMSSENNVIIKKTSSLLCSLFKERDLVLKGN
jgi:hypothetical protein